MDIFKKTAEFNSKILGVPRPYTPTQLSVTRKDWAVTFLGEELTEFVDADTLADEVDALLDMIYVAGGRLYEMGVDGAACFEEVHRANMTKVRGELSKRPNSLGFDAIKPEGWTPPDIARHMAGPRHPKILVLGHGRHGKDTFCEILCDLAGLRFTSSSMFCAEEILLPYFNGHPDLPTYSSVEECYSDRHSQSEVDRDGVTSTYFHRAIWFEQIAAYCNPDGAKLARGILERNDIYCGMRNASELVPCIKEGLFDHIVWVDRSEHEPDEPISSMNITKEMADYVVDNNGTLDDLVEEVHKFIEHVRLHA